MRFVVATTVKSIAVEIVGILKWIELVRAVFSCTWYILNIWKNVQNQIAKNSYLFLEDYEIMR